MKVLAFLQNMWVRDPERVKAMIAKDGEVFRRRFMHYALFAGCLTGRRLRAAFGHWCDSIIWEEVSREIGGKASSVFPADISHIAQRIAEEKPDVILVFGHIATEGLARAGYGGVPLPKLITGPHPAARSTDVERLLLGMRRQLVDVERALQV